MPGSDPVEDVLCTARNEATSLVEELREELMAIAESTRANPDDEHDVEGSTVAFERARVTGLLRMAELALHQIDDALDRCRAKTYGRCEGCGARIAAERLAALPAATRCRACATAPGTHPGLQRR